MTTPVIGQVGGYRIIDQDGEYRVYGHDGRLIGRASTYRIAEAILKEWLS